MHAYSIVRELYATSATTFQDSSGRSHDVPALTFEYAIRREDGSLLVRAKNRADADYILSKLVTAQLAAA